MHYTIQGDDTMERSTAPVPVPTPAPGSGITDCNYKNGSANPSSYCLLIKLRGKEMLPLNISTSLLTYVLPGACSTTFSRLPPKQPLSANNTTSSGENGSAPELK